MIIRIPRFEDVKLMYQRGYHTKDTIKWFVEMKALDKEEYALITGEKYPESQV
ncbi:XkdX family protein [Staphylococcus xylosus]